MLTRLIRWQLSIFAVLTVFAVTAVALFYLHVPAALGFGNYRVTAEFEASGGLYVNANVTYRGTTIGRVSDVSLTHDHSVEARLRLNDDTPVPYNVTATVKSVSAVGEQYVDLVPPADPSKKLLRNGSRIDRSHTAISQDVAGLLRAAQDLVNSLDQSRLKDLLREAFTAFDGSGPELARLIQSARLLIEEANNNAADTTALIDQAGPFLDAQIRSGDNITSLADGLARFSTQVRQADPQLRGVLQNAPSAATEATSTFSGLKVPFPVLAANLANVGRIGVIYRKSIEQILVLVPAQTAVLLAIGKQLPLDEGAKADFKLNLGDPPPCSVGFIPPSQIRSPADETLRELPKDMYCKVPQNDPTVVRGARNYPCQEFPGKRAPTIQLCRDPRGYVPLGSNPWRGPPVPVGTPITDPRMILPQNKYPYIPPEADYDPGPPVVQLPPGVPPGPGPALTPPYPAAVPPASGPPPAPLPYVAPPGESVPPYGQPPAAPPPPPAPLPAEAPMASSANPQSVRIATAKYDPKTGVFQDPNGDFGVFADGAAKIVPAETWVDLMLDPRSS
jgi:phospholipid/cholesterol/gamma-HCH transport system substrate-binding protein